jgi:hypothetical protein
MYSFVEDMVRGDRDAMVSMVADGTLQTEGRDV